tara:strand:+ start:114 stop:698 length:585 start_codon:yes stop_codon:yes gene_type:complete
MTSHLRQLLITAAQVSTSMAVGDVICQCLEQDAYNLGLNSVSIDVKRSSRMFLVGAFVSGPWSHCQYQLLEKFIPGNTGGAVAKKVLSAAALAPIGISLMFSSVLLLQGKSEKIEDKLKDDVLETWAIGALYWPAVLTMNFKFVPLNSRPLVGAFAGSFWNIYTAYQANKVVVVLEDTREVEDTGHEKTFGQDH